jgi:hypothetical protein
MVGILQTDGMKGRRGSTRLGVLRDALNPLQRGNQSHSLRAPQKGLQVEIGATEGAHTLQGNISNNSVTMAERL